MTTWKKYLVYYEMLHFVKLPKTLRAGNMLSSSFFAVLCLLVCMLYSDNPWINVPVEIWSAATNLHNIMKSLVYFGCGVW